VGILKPVNACKHHGQKQFGAMNKIKTEFKPVPRVSISFPALPKIWGCAQTWTLTN
jgi:hypothetical protein